MVRPKKILFFCFLCTLPIFFLFLFEVVFRLFHYGGDLDLFVLRNSGNVSEYVLNENFLRRYFFQKGIKTPVPLSQRFPANKDTSTIRVFCLGESTTQGFPYPPNGAYPAILKTMLTDLFPQNQIEVLNCGITGITSHCVLDIEREIVRKYHPDLLVVYTGHNEFYGVFGEASNFSPFHSQRLVKLFLSLQRSRLFLLIRDAVTALFSRRIEPTVDGSSRTLMSLMAKEIGIEMDSGLFRRTAENFRLNLADICDTAEKHDVPLILCTLVDNRRDLPPFASRHCRTFSVRDSLSWQRLMEEADREFAAQRCENAVLLYQRALALDTCHALTHYRLAQYLEVIQDFAAASEHYLKAKDHDAVRFRAPTLFNRLITRTAEERNIPLADCEAAFVRNSPNGLIGGELLHEHVHPNLRGHLLLARSIAETIKQSNVLGRKATGRLRGDEEYAAKCRLTLLDQEVVNYMLFRLTSQWPFVSSSRMLYRRIGTEKTEALAKKLIDEQSTNLVELHLILGSEFHEKSEFAAAEAEYLAAQAICPTAEGYDHLGRLYLRLTESAYRDEKDYEQAVFYFNRGIATFTEGLQRFPDDLQMTFNLGLLYLMRADYTEVAENQFRQVIRLNPHHLNSHKLLIEHYLRQRRFKEAKILAQQAVERFPQEGRFHTYWGIICAQENNLPEAINHLEKAVRLGDEVKANALLQTILSKANRKTDDRIFNE